MVGRRLFNRTDLSFLDRLFFIWLCVRSKPFFFKFTVVCGTLIKIISWMLHYKHIAAWVSIEILANKNTILDKNHVIWKEKQICRSGVQTLDIVSLLPTAMRFFVCHDVWQYSIDIKDIIILCHHFYKERGWLTIGYQYNWHTDISVIALIIFIATDLKLILQKYKLAQYCIFPE